MAVRPVVKWVGGKRQLVPEIMRRIPTEFDRETAQYLSRF